MKQLLKKTCQPILAFCALFFLALIPEVSASADLSIGSKVTVTVDYSLSKSIVAQTNAKYSTDFQLDADLTAYAAQLAADIGSGCYAFMKPSEPYIYTHADTLFSKNGNKKNPYFSGCGILWEATDTMSLAEYYYPDYNLVGLAEVKNPNFKFMDQADVRYYAVVYGKGTCTPVTQNTKTTKTVTIGANPLSSESSTNTNTNTGTNTNTPSNPSVGNTSAPSAGLVLKKTVSGENYSVTVAYTQTTGNNKAKKPKITVKYNGKKVNSKYYTVKYSSNKNPGLATVTVKGKSSYKNKIPTTKLQFVIKPAKMKAPTAKAQKGAITVSWKKQTNVSGYEIQISTSKNFKSNLQSFTATSGKSKAIKNLMNKKTYYVRTRAYKNIQGTVFYGSWSSAKKVKTK